MTSLPVCRAQANRSSRVPGQSESSRSTCPSRRPSRISRAPRIGPGQVSPVRSTIAAGSPTWGRFMGKLREVLFGCDDGLVRDEDPAAHGLPAAKAGTLQQEGIDVAKVVDGDREGGGGPFLELDLDAAPADDAPAHAEG